MRLPLRINALPTGTPILGGTRLPLRISALKAGTPAGKAQVGQAGPIGRLIALKAHRSMPGGSGVSSSGQLW